MPQIIPAVATLILEVWGAVAVSMPVWAPTAATYAAYAVVAAGTYASIRSMQKIPAFGNLQSDANGKITMQLLMRKLILSMNILQD